MKRIYIFGLFIVIALVVAGCAQSPPAAPAPAEEAAQQEAAEEPAQEVAAEAKTADDAVDIIMVQHAQCAWDKWWCDMQAADELAAEHFNINLTILGPDEFDLNKTAELIDQARAAQPDAMAITVTDPDLFREPINRVIESGIPVIGYNAGNGPIIDDIPYLTYFGMDEYTGGLLGGRRLAALGPTRAVCINHQVGHTGLDARCAGFSDAMSEIGVEVDTLSVSNDPAETQSIIDDYTAANPDVDTFFTLGPTGATPFYGWMDSTGLGPGDLIHGTFDESEEIHARLLDGTTAFGVDQQPYLQGYGTLAMLALNVRYGLSPASPQTLTGPAFVTADNLGFEADPDRPVKIILVQHAECSWGAFWCIVQRGATDAAAAMNVDVQILGPDSFDLNKTAELIDQAVASQPDAIGLTVTDPDLFREPIENALAAGIPVIGYNAGSGPDVDGIAYLTYIGADEYQGGYQGGHRLAALGGTRAVCINHQVGHTGLDARCQGFVDALAEKDIPVEILAGTNDPAEMQSIVDDFYAANPDVDMFLTLGPATAAPFYGFMENNGLTADDIIHGTFDLSPEIIANIKSGVTQFGIDQQPYLQGYWTVLMLTLKVRQGIDPVLPITPTGPGFVDASNVELVEALAGEYR